MITAILIGFVLVAPQGIMHAGRISDQAVSTDS